MEGKRIQRRGQFYPCLWGTSSGSGLPLPFWSTAGVLLRASGYSHSRDLSILIGSSSWCLKVPFLRLSGGGEECGLLSLIFSNLLLENFGVGPATLHIPCLGSCCWVTWHMSLSLVSPFQTLNSVQLQDTGYRVLGTYPLRISAPAKVVVWCSSKKYHIRGLRIKEWESGD